MLGRLRTGAWIGSLGVMVACGVEGAKPQTAVADSTLSSADGTLSAVLSVQSSGSTGLCANVQVSNSGNEPTAWTVVLKLNGTTITNSWNAQFAANGDEVTVFGVGWNVSIGPRGSSNFGFCGTSSSSSAQPTVASLARSSSGNGATGNGNAAANPNSATGAPPNTNSAVGASPNPNSATGGVVNGAGNNVATGGSTTACSGYVALTFDDGPGSNTTALLDILKKNGPGPRCSTPARTPPPTPPWSSPKSQAGMWVNNHSYTHGHMTSMSQSDMQTSSRGRTRRSLRAGRQPKIFRPPYGETNATLQAAASSAGLKLVTWDVDSQDWNGAGTDSIVAAAGKLTNGQIILMHDGYQTTNAAIPQIMANLKAKGLCPGMIDPSSGRAVAPTGASSGGGGGTTPGTGGTTPGTGGTTPGTGGTTPGTGGTTPGTGGTTPGTGGTTPNITTSCTEAQKTLSGNGSGSHCGYTYEYWKDTGTGCLVLKSDGFSVDWSNINNLLGRKGLRPGSKSNVVTYEANYQPNGNSYLCVYGWTKSPLVEYYIVDSWGSWRPPGGEGQMGTVTCDGATYDIYKTQRVNQPSIEGNTTFYQYWSVRQQKRTSGTITVGCHFDAWAGKGMNMGSLYEVSMTVEGYQSSGTADVKMSMR